MRSYSVMVSAFLAGACSSSGSSSTEANRGSVLLQVYQYAIDSIENGDRIIRCLALIHGGEGSDPPSDVLASLRVRDSLLLAFSQCRNMNDNFGIVHDTVLIIVNPDSIVSSSPKVAMRTWRSGTWGAAFSCYFRRTTMGWKLKRCDLERIS